MKPSSFQILGTVIAGAGCISHSAAAVAALDPGLGIGVYAKIAPDAGSASSDGPSTALYTTQLLSNGVFNTPSGGLRTTVGSVTTLISTLPDPMPAGLLTGRVDVQADASTAMASASLARGESRLLAVSSSAVPTTVSVQTYLADTVRWQVDSAAGADVTFKVHVDGTIGGIAGVAFYSQNISFGLGPAGFGWGAVANPFAGSQFASSGLDTWQSASLLGQSLSGFDFSGVVHVNNQSSSLLTFTQSVLCLDGARCDFSNTSRLSFVLPPGVGYTSNSGELFAAAVPEPASWLLGACGLAIVAGRLHGRRRGRRDTAG